MIAFFLFVTATLAGLPLSWFRAFEFVASFSFAGFVFTVSRMELVLVSSGELRSMVVGALPTVPLRGRVETAATGAGLAGGVSCLRVLRRRPDILSNSASDRVEAVKSSCVVVVPGDSAITWWHY